jgi:thiamine transport system ATP-binding protein
MLLLDEPFASLDRALREELIGDVARLLAAERVPAILVTHDHDEAFALADHVAVMRSGSIVQMGPPADVWGAPVDEWTARFLGFDAVADGVVADGLVSTPWGRLPAPASADGAARVVLRPGAFTVDAKGPWRGSVQAVHFRGDRSVADVRVGQEPTLEVAVDHGVAPGADLSLSLDSSAVLVYPITRSLPHPEGD